MKDARKQQRLSRHAVNNFGVFAFKHITVRRVGLDQRAFDRDGSLDWKREWIAHIKLRIVEPVHIGASGGIVLVPLVKRLAILVSGRQYKRTAKNELIALVGDAITDQRHIHRPK